MLAVHIGCLPCACDALVIWGCRDTPRESVSSLHTTQFDGLCVMCLWPMSTQKKAMREKIRVIS